LIAAAILMALAVGVAACQLPGAGAAALLHPGRHVTRLPPPEGCDATDFVGDGIRLRGWRCPAPSAPRGTVIYLHGIGDNRGSSVGVIQRFRGRGFDVVAYDSRANGESDGAACTYGFYEKRDLHDVLDTARAGPVVLIGHSLGAAVALQEAADDSRVAAVVAAETFSDLRTIATERAPFVFTPPSIRAAFAMAERQAQFTVDEVSPEHAAARISIPVLLLHGDADTDTRPDHSRRVFAALHGPKQLILVPGAHHNGALRADVWPAIEGWIDRALARP
jgi:alpha-beta hydrolase superfamily lysophospholipase